MNDKKNSESEVDADALVKGGASALVYGGVTGLAGWWLDKALDNPEKLKYNNNRIADINYSFNSVWNMNGVEFQTAIGNPEPEKWEEKVNIALHNHEANRNSIIVQRLLLTSAVVVGAVVMGVVAYNHFHEENQKKEMQPKNAIVTDNINQELISNIQPNATEQKKR